MTERVIESRNGDAYLDGHMLICVYDEGDCDVAPAVPKTPKEERMLERALYDLHQCYEVLQDGDVVCLPNGEPFACVIGVHVGRIERS